MCALFHEYALSSPAESFPSPSMRLCPVKPLQRLSAWSMATVEYRHTGFRGMRVYHPLANHLLIQQNQITIDII